MRRAYHLSHCLYRAVRVRQIKETLVRGLRCSLVESWECATFTTVTTLLFLLVLLLLILLLLSSGLPSNEGDPVWYFSSACSLCSQVGWQWIYHAGKLQQICEDRDLALIFKLNKYYRMLKIICLYKILLKLMWRTCLFYPKDMTLL